MPMTSTGLLTGLGGMAAGGSPATQALGLGGNLQGQVLDETEAERKKRLQMAQQQALLGPSGSMAVTSLFGRGLAGAASTF